MIYVFSHNDAKSAELHIASRQAKRDFPDQCVELESSYDALQRIPGAVAAYSVGEISASPEAERNHAARCLVLEEHGFDIAAEIIVIKDAAWAAQIDAAITSAVQDAIESEF